VAEVRYRQRYFQVTKLSAFAWPRFVADFQRPARESMVPVRDFPKEHVMRRLERFPIRLTIS